MSSVDFSMLVVDNSISNVSEAIVVGYTALVAFNFLVMLWTFFSPFSKFDVSFKVFERCLLLSGCLFFVTGFMLRADGSIIGGLYSQVLILVSGIYMLMFTSLVCIYMNSPSEKMVFRVPVGKRGFFVHKGTVAACLFVFSCVHYVAGTFLGLPIQTEYISANIECELPGNISLGYEPTAKAC